MESREPSSTLSMSSTCGLISWAEVYWKLTMVFFFFFFLLFCLSNLFCLRSQSRSPSRRDRRARSPDRKRDEREKESYGPSNYRLGSNPALGRQRSRSRWVWFLGHIRAQKDSLFGLQWLFFHLLCHKYNKIILYNYV